MFEMNFIADKLYQMLEEDEAINHYRRIFLNGSEEEKEKNKAMLFLGDPKFDSKTWVRKALDDFEAKAEFAVFREVNDMSPITPAGKCVIVKAYRKLKKNKYPTDAVSIVEETKRLLGVN